MWVNFQEFIERPGLKYFGRTFCILLSIVLRLMGSIRVGVMHLLLINVKPTTNQF